MKRRNLFRGKMHQPERCCKTENGKRDDERIPFQCLGATNIRTAPAKRETTAMMLMYRNRRNWANSSENCLPGY